MHLLKQHLSWYELAQLITNKTPTSEGNSPYKLSVFGYGIRDPQIEITRI